jgi:hypothetical protein
MRPDTLQAFFSGPVPPEMAHVRDALGKSYRLRKRTLAPEFDAEQAEQAGTLAEKEGRSKK